MTGSTAALQLADRPVFSGVGEGVSLHAAGPGAAFVHLAPGAADLRCEWSLGLVEEGERFAALHRFVPYWMRPTAGAADAPVPAETQWLMVRRRDGSHLLVVPLLDGASRFTLRGGLAALTLVGDSNDSATPCTGGRAAYVAIGDDPYQLNREGAARVAAALGTRLRVDKPLPDFVDHFGWCTWDAFYSEVSAEKVRGGLESFRAGGVEPRLLILDDGWQQIADAPTGGKRMVGMAANDKFSGDLAPLVRMAKDEYGVRNLLVWHAIMGYWGGIDGELRSEYAVEDSRKSFGQDLIEYFPNLGSWHGGPRVGVIGIRDVARFYHDFHRSLAAQGVDGVKVDNQASLEAFAEDRGGRVAVTRAYREALEGAVQVHFGGKLINCMSHATETWYQSPGSVVIRGSDDFWPDKPESHGLHLATNAAVGLWFGEFMHIDWDMFQSAHARGAFHAAGRALSGGPIYVSDKPDAHDFAVLRALVDDRGDALRCAEPGRLCPDCLYHDVAGEAVPLKIWNRAGAAALVGAFHACHEQAGALAVRVGPRDVPGLAGERFALRRHRTGEIAVLGADEAIDFELAAEDWEIVSLVPVVGELAAFGAADKYAAPLAIASQGWRGSTWWAELRCGGRFALWCGAAPSSARYAGEELAVSALGAAGELLLELPEGAGGTLELTFA